MKAIASLALLLALAGCGIVERVLQPSAASSGAAVDELADYLARLRGMNEARLASEAATQRQNAARHPGTTTRLKAAIALTLARPADETEVLTLIEPVLHGDSATRQAQGMASFLQAIALERRRMRESAAGASARLKDERRALEVQKQRADALQERAAQLQQKLDALSELEKSLSDRGSPNR